MTTGNNSLKYLRPSLVFVVAYLASLIAWWWQHRSTLFSGPVEVWFDYIALACNIPGWVILAMFDRSHAELRTNLSDILIPLVSGGFWGLFALLVVKLLKILGKFARASAKSR